MLYSELLEALKPYGLEQVGRLTLGNRGSVTIARASEVCFPFSFQGHTLYAPAGEVDWEISQQEIDALARRFNITLNIGRRH